MPGGVCALVRHNLQLLRLNARAHVPAHRMAAHSRPSFWPFLAPACRRALGCDRTDGHVSPVFVLRVLLLRLLQLLVLWPGLLHARLLLRSSSHIRWTVGAMPAWRCMPMRQLAAAALSQPHPTGRSLVLLCNPCDALTRTPATHSHTQVLQSDPPLWIRSGPEAQPPGAAARARTCGGLLCGVWRCHCRTSCCSAVLSTLADPSGEEIAAGDRDVSASLRLPAFGCMGPQTVAPCLPSGCLQLRTVPMLPRDRDLEGSGLATIL